MQLKIIFLLKISNSQSFGTLVDTQHLHILSFKGKEIKAFQVESIIRKLIE